MEEISLRTGGAKPSWKMDSTLYGILKFNVNRETGKPGQAGADGVLHEHNGVILKVFFGLLDIKASNGVSCLQRGY